MGKIPEEETPRKTIIRGKDGLLWSRGEGRGKFRIAWVSSSQGDRVDALAFRF
jgi:hypothetical protein